MLNISGYPYKSNYGYYNMFNEWFRYHKYQAIYNYPLMYNAIIRNPETVNVILLVFLLWLLDRLIIRNIFMNKVR